MSVISKNITSFIGLRFLGLCTIVVLAFILLVLADIIWKGAGTLSWDFIFSVPRKGMTEGGIYPALVGTTMVTVITAIFSIPVGVATAVYLNEYASDNMFTKILRASIRNLAGVPSIIYGLFGVALFVEALRLGNSVVSSGLTLGLMTLPYIITATEEALRSVPHSHREGALALGSPRHGHCPFTGRHQRSDRYGGRRAAGDQAGGRHAGYWRGVSGNASGGGERHRRLSRAECAHSGAGVH